MLRALLFAALCATWAGLEARAQAPEKPGSPVRTVASIDFDARIKPLLQTRCLKCHSRGKYKGGLSLETRASILRGGEDGPAVVVGKSDESLLIELVSGLDPVRRMPDRGEPLTPAEIGLLRAWIDRGLSWPEGFTFGFRTAQLEPRRPAIPAAPAGSDLRHPIDRFVARYIQEQEVAIDWTSASDRVFARRVSLDLVGLLLTSEQLSAFENDMRPDKRALLVSSLLAQRRSYADHWLTFWNDLLRNGYRGTGFIDGGRKTLTQWLYEALYENKPYDRFVHELISPVPGSEGFVKGIIWRGVVNASQVPAVQAAQNLSQVFLGTNLKCASCHDSFVNQWKLTDAYALASVFADQPLEIHRCDKPTGQKSTIGFIYPQLGSIDGSASRAERMKQLADLLVKPEDGRFARAIVNRLWAQLMGRGLGEPLDDLDRQPWSQDLLDWLASDLVEHGYDLKQTLALICTSRAYQLPAVPVPDPAGQGSYVFVGPWIKRMTAEQFLDSISTVTGVWPQITGEMLKVDGRGQGGQMLAVRAAIAAADKQEAVTAPAPPKVKANWIWSHADAEHDPGGRILLRTVLKLEAVPERAVAVATCDNELVLYINGQQVAQSTEWNRPVAVDVTNHLKPGDNVIAAEATNWPDPEHNRGTNAQAPNPAAFIAWVGGFEGDKVLWDRGSDGSWLWTKSAQGDWLRQPYDTTGWQHAVELPMAARTYPRVDLSAAVLETTPGALGHARAALNFDDPLLTALGRTNREQVVTRRDSIATTLQALELTNGTTLDAMLEKGARRWFDQRGNQPEELVRQVFLSALGRTPNPTELATSLELIGAPATREGVEDLLWAIAMLPEFQLIY